MGTWYLFSMSKHSPGQCSKERPEEPSLRLSHMLHSSGLLLGAACPFGSWGCSSWCPSRGTDVSPAHHLGARSSAGQLASSPDVTSIARALALIIFL